MTSFTAKVQFGITHCFQVCLFSLLQSVTDAQYFLDFSWPGHFWRLQSVTLWNILHLRFVWCFLIMKFRLSIVGRMSTENMLCSFHCLLSDSTWLLFVPLLVMFNVEHLIKMLPHYEVILFPFITQYWRGGALK